MRLLFVVIIGIVLSSCNMNNKGTEPSSDTSATHHVKVEEVLQTNAYTYLFVKENNQDYWMAVSKMNAKVGDDFYYEEALEMQDFKSKELDRVFDRILFIQSISSVPLDSKVSTQDMSNHGGENFSKLKGDIQIEPVSGSISIAELYKNRNDYSNKKVMVRGQVVKINKEIMDRNWVHLQDGTNDSGNYDLTLTTHENMNVGDVVTLEGTVSLNKKFGEGYSYELIVEGASLK